MICLLGYPRQHLPKGKVSAVPGSTCLAMWWWSFDVPDPCICAQPYCMRRRLGHDEHSDRVQTDRPEPCVGRMSPAVGSSSLGPRWWRHAGQCRQGASRTTTST